MFFLPSNLFPKLAFRSLKNGTARRASHRRSRLSTTHHTALYRIEQLEDRTLLSVAVYSSGDVPKDILDQSTVVSTLNVPDSITISDINVTLDISHTKDQDLDVYLISPNNTRVELFTDVDGGGNDFSGTTLDDEAATSITTGTAPFSGSFRPEGSLATLDGENSLGVWILEVTDDKRRNTGTLNSWSIEITSAGPPTISIDDATVTEGDESFRFIDNFVPVVSGLNAAKGVTFGPDGHLYVASQFSNEVLRYNGETGAFLGAFVPADSGGLDGPRRVVFGPDNNVYVTSFNSDAVLRYDATGVPLPAPGKTGATFVSPGAGGLDGPVDVVFDVNGDLLVSSEFSDEILRYNGSSGDFAGTFVTAGNGGQIDPKGMELGADGNLYVASKLTDSVMRYDGVSGAPLPGPLGAAGTAEFVPAGSGGLFRAQDLVFGPDGNLYVTSSDNDSILRYDGTSGAFIDSIDPQGTGGLDFPTGIAIGPDGNIYVGERDNNEVLRYGVASQAVFTVSLSSPSAVSVTVNYDTGGGDATAGSDYTAVTNGSVVFDPGVTTRTIIVQTLDDTEIEDDETFLVTLSGEVGATISKGIGQGTILDDDTPPTISISNATVTEGDASIQFIDAFVSAGNGGLDAPKELTFGPDGNIYVSNGLGDSVLRYDAATGEFIDVFVSASAGLDNPQGILFGPDGNLYVTSRLTDEVFRFNGVTGALIDTFVIAGSGGLDNPVDITFGDDGNLYVTSRETNEVLRYDGATGAFIDVFVTDSSGGLDDPHGLQFGPDGNLYVAQLNGDPNSDDLVSRYDGTTGAFIDVFVTRDNGSLNDALYLVFGPDGDLYVSRAHGDSVQRYDGSTGAYIEDYVGIGSGGLDRPDGLLFDSNGNLYVSSLDSDEILRYGAASQAVFTVSLSSPSAVPVTVNYSTADDTTPPSAEHPASAGSDYTTTSGTVVFDPGVTTRMIIVPTLNDSEAEFDETFLVDLSIPTNATIADGQGVATIKDDDNTTQIFVSTDVPKNIRDLKTITSTITVSDPLRILDINVQLDITHTNAEDLDVFLIAPDGITRVELFTDVGGTGNNFSGTILDDEAPGSIVDGSAPFTGSFQPEGSLSSLIASDAQGTWTLEITDDSRREKGKLNSWSLTITEAPPVGVTVTNTTGLVTTEDGGTASFTVVLDSPPTGTVSIHLVPSDTTEGRLEKANSDDQTLEFDETNWDIEQEVTVIGVDDLLLDFDIFYEIIIDVILSVDPDYLLIDPDDVKLINLDNDAPLHAAGGAAGDGTVAAASLTQATLRAVVDQAVVLWQAAGVDPSLTAKLNAVPVQVADFSGSLLGIASSSGGIWIDRDAAGFGWSTNAWAVNPGRIDLLSVVSHELGHLVGFDHDVMSATLQTGLRELPTSRFPVAHRGGPTPPSSVSSSLFVLGTGSPLSTEEDEAPAVDLALLLRAPVLLEEQPDDESPGKDSITNEEIASTDIGVYNLFAEFNESLSDDLLTV